MSSIEQLIAEHCRDEVVFKPISEIATLVRGSGMPKTDLVGEGVGAIHYGQIYTHYGVWASETYSFVTPETAEKLAKAEPGDIIVTNTSENLRDVGKAVAWLGSETIVTGGHATVMKHNQEPKYLAYWFASAGFSEQKRRLATGTKVIDVSAKQLATMQIPVPSREVQREIVRVLDQFTQLEAELKAELEARRNQRSALAINFEVMRKAANPDEFEVAKLGELVQESQLPVSLQDDEIYVTIGVRWNGEGVLLRKPRRGGEIKAQTLYRVQPGQLVYNRMFVVEGSFAVVPPEASGAVASGEFPVFNIDETKVNPEWLTNFLTSKHTLSRIEREVTGTERGSMKSRRRWKSDQLKRFDLALPSLERQLSEVELLRTCDDLMYELQAEIAARREQYKYYLDNLLAFEGAAA